MSLDLHMHSWFSDGTKSPRELVQLAVNSGLSAIAITDHDTMAGIEEAIAAGGELGVEIVPGIELSVVQKRKPLHILGYFMDSAGAKFSTALKILQEERDNRNTKIISKLQKLGVNASIDELKEISGPGQTGRPHIAKLLVNHGCVRSMQQAFDEYLKKDGRAYVSRFAYSAEDAISLIKDAGGLSVLAHPIQVDKSLNYLTTLLPVLRHYGLDGIETYYPTQKKGMRKRIRRFAEEYGLFLTGGSDYHGDIRPGTRLAGSGNVYVSSSLLDNMKACLKKQNSKD